MRLETEAILSFLGPAVPDAVFLRSAAHRLENAFNTVVPRRQAVSSWLSAGPLDVVPVSELATRAGELVALGFGKFDALHLGSAELAGADVFVTVDRRLLACAARNGSKLRVRTVDPLRLAEEVLRDSRHH